jgi:hypothetical protein
MSGLKSGPISEAKAKTGARATTRTTAGPFDSSTHDKAVGAFAQDDNLSGNARENRELNVRGSREVLVFSG